MTTFWTAENRPEDHPLWAEQVMLERTMLTTGADQYRATVNKALEKGAMDTLKPYRRITEEMLPRFAEAIRRWREACAADKRKAEIAYLSTQGIPDDLVAYITLRAVLNQLTTTGASEHTAMALQVGASIEHEARLQAWRARDATLFEEMEKSLRDPDHPDKRVSRGSVLAAMREDGTLTLASIEQHLKDQRATPVHRRRVIVNKFNKEMRDKGEWTAWPHQTKLHVGNRLLGWLAESTGRFKRVTADTWERGKSPPKVYLMDQELQDWLSNGLEREELLHPFFMPTIIPPRDWTSLTEGGYHTDLLPQRLMIRFKADHEEQRRSAIADMSRVYMPVAYDALNTAQSVPWRINEGVYAVAVVAWANDLQLAKLPRKARFPDAFRDASIPPKGQPLTKEQEALLLAYKKAQAKIEGDNARLAARKFKTDRLLDTAERFVGKDFYFPHVLDFRGRMYPIPVDLNPQGEDLARGLLTFANGRPVDEDAAKWLAIQVCNTFGNDKISFEKRVQWTRDREETWRRVAADPLANREWATMTGPEKVSEPWQHLAAILEWVRYLDRNPKEEFVSSLPIRVDGTCNGIQHLSAMIRDEEGGASVNLVPDGAPHDIYKEVAVLVQAELERLAAQDEGNLSADEVAKHDNAVFWLHAFDEAVPRSLTKRPVMILPYGGTREAYFKYITEWMDEFDPGKKTFPEDRRYKAARFMVNVMWGIIREKLKRAVAVQQWLKEVAQITADNSLGTPLMWYTPDRMFLVRQFYGQREEKDLKSAYDSGPRIKMVIWETTAELDRQRHLQSIAPNFTHAMDAAVLMETIRWAEAARLTEFTAIHDAYGTVAADVALLHAGLRKAFVKLYAEHDPLGDFLAACRDTAETYRRAKGLDEKLVWPARPTEGSLDIREVMNSYYFVA